MKYKEFNMNEKLFGKDYLVYDWEEEIHIFIKSKSHMGIMLRKNPKSNQHLSL